MAVKRPLATLFSLPPPLRTALPTHQTRAFHRVSTTTPSVPKPTPFVPDVSTFLTLIGRGLSAHASKIPSWSALFSLSSEQLREAGVEPARARRYLLHWRDKFRNGVSGIGGDAKHVKDGVAELRIVEMPSERKMDARGTLTRGPGMRKVVVNTQATLPTTESEQKMTESEKGTLAKVEPFAPKILASEANTVAGIKIVQGVEIGGKGVQSVKGHQGVARLRVQEGLWEQKRGHKVDGGERRRAMVRSKRRAEERKNAR